MICDDSKGTHWINMSKGKGKFRDFGIVKKGFCAGKGHTTQWADVNGDGKADMVCYNTGGQHWIQMSNGLDDGGLTFTDLGMVLSDWCNKFE